MALISSSSKGGGGGQCPVTLSSYRQEVYTKQKLAYERSISCGNHQGVTQDGNSS